MENKHGVQKGTKLKSTGPCRHHQLQCGGFGLVPMPLAALDLSDEPHSETSPEKEEGGLPRGMKTS